MGLDRSIPEQLAIYAGDVLRGDLGRSYTTGEAVVDDLAARLPASLELTVTAFLLAILVALPLGVVAATRPGSAIDHLCRAIAAAGGDRIAGHRCAAGRRYRGSGVGAGAHGAAL